MSNHIINNYNNVTSSNATPHTHKCHPITHKLWNVTLPPWNSSRCNRLPIHHQLPKEVANTLDTKSKFPIPIMHHHGSQLPHCMHGHHRAQCMWLASIKLRHANRFAKGLTTIYPRRTCGFPKPSLPLKYPSQQRPTMPALYWHGDCIFNSFVATRLWALKLRDQWSGRTGS